MIYLLVYLYTKKLKYIMLGNILC